MLLPCASVGLLVLFARQVKRREHPIGLGRLLAGNALVLFCLLVLLFLTCETYFRFAYNTTDSLGCTKVCERWEERHWHVNAAGCRDNIEYFPAIQPGRRRVSFVGDSFTAGHGIRNVEDRFPNWLRRAHPDWEIHVLANVGLDTGAEQILLNKAFPVGYQVDQVVLVYCLNDVSDVMSEQSQTYEQILANSDRSRWFVRNSYFVNLLYQHYQTSKIPLLKDYSSFVRDAYHGPLWKWQKQWLTAFRDLVQSHGGRNLPLLQRPRAKLRVTLQSYNSRQPKAGFWPTFTRR
jgi:hypothetical protein